MKILLTGDHGFIGNEIAKQLLERGYFVVGIDNQSKYSTPNDKHTSHKNYKGFKLDIIKDFEKLDDVFQNEKPDFIIHTAARIGGIRLFHEEQFELLTINARIDANILELAVKHKVNRFVGLSSSMVYENTKVYPSREEDISIPTSTYGFSKLALEKMIQGAHEQHGLEFAICRPFNAVSVGESDFMEGKSSHVLPDLVVKCLKNDDYITLLGSGEQIRHFTHTKDVARGIILAMESPHKNETFNISTSKSTSIKELAKLVWDEVHPNRPFQYKTSAGFRDDVAKRIPDVSKAKRMLGFEAETPLVDGVREVSYFIMKWFVENNP